MRLTWRNTRLDRFCGCRPCWQICFNKTPQMDVWVLPKCIRKCDIVFRGVWARARRGERVVSFKSPGPCVATLLNQLTPLVRGHSSAGLLQPAPGGVIWGLSWCLTHCSTSTHSGYGLTPPLGSRRTVNLQQSKVNCDADGHGCTHKVSPGAQHGATAVATKTPRTAPRHHGHASALTFSLVWHPGC